MSQVPRHDHPPAQPPHQHLSPTAGLDLLEFYPAAEVSMGRETASTHRVEWGLVTLSTIAYMGRWLALLCPRKAR
jgi:hypothetical protein